MNFIIIIIIIIVIIMNLIELNDHRMERSVLVFVIFIDTGMFASSGQNLLQHDPDFIGFNAIEFSFKYINSIWLIDKTVSSLRCFIGIACII